ncbi:D-alanyl-D-alanine carboxypeptidase family protein [Streptomyces sp. CA-111067]|uniref:D-alanyl-D-alanine carboxypeptidase family protein n=1 Tax=Streptomyces sp. CA-111067 TaxID=3240046 RepID=UPI003D95CD81
MTAFRDPRSRQARPAPGVQARPGRLLGAAARPLAVGCALAAAAAVATGPAAALTADGGHGPHGSGGAPAGVAGGPLLAKPGVQVRPEAGTPALPEGLSGLSWTVSDARTGQVLAAKDAHRKLPPASTLKTLFADTVLPRFTATTTHKVTDQDLAGTGEGSSLVGVQAGQTYTVADLWRGVFLASGNDAVHVLAHMNGSVQQTVTQMQAKADMLGAHDTHVVSPDGYDYPGQLSSAYDLALFARAGLTNHDFAQYAGTASAQFPGGYDAHGKFVKSFGIQNTNRLLTGADGVRRYPGIIGVKNGYTTNAGNTLIAAAKHGDRTLIVTVMNPQSGMPQAVYHEAASLLDWGFAAAGHTSSVGTLNEPAPVAYEAPAAPAPVRPQPVADDSRPAGPAEQAAAVHGSASWSVGWYVGGGLALAAAVGAVPVVRRRRRAARWR